MIGDIRKTLQTTKVKILIYVSLISIVAGSSIALLLSRIIGGRSDRVVTVNGHDVTQLEFVRKIHEIQNIVNQVRQTQGVEADKVLKMWGLDRRPDEIVLEALIGEKIIKSATQRLGTAVHPEYVQAKLSDQYFVYQNLRGIIPEQALRGGTIDVAALERNLERQGISMDKFDELLEDALLRSFLFNLIEAGLYIPDEALKNAYIGQKVKKKYAYLPLSLAGYVAKAKGSKLTDTEIASYYNNKEHQEQYRIPEKRSAKVWTFSPSTFGVIVSDADLKTYYNRNRRSYIKKPEQVKVQHILLKYTKDTKTEVRANAQEIYNEVKANPEKFSARAAEKSSSSDKGATITIKREDKNRVFTIIAFGLKKDGISAVRETSDGFEIIKLIERVKPEFKPLDDVKSEIGTKLKKEKFERIFDANAQRVVSQSRQTPAFLAKFIEQHKGQLSMVKDATLTEKPQSQKIFKVRKIGDKTFYQDGGKGYIVELTSEVKSKIPALAAIKSKLTDDIYKGKALELLNKDLKQGLKEIRSGKKTLAQVAQSLQGTVDITDWITFSDKDSIKKLDDMKISLPEVAQLTVLGAIISDVTDTHGYLIQVKQMDPFKSEEFEKEKAQIRTTLTRQESQGLTSAFIQSLRDQANISLNEDLLKQAGR